jgi:hypothetical protein
MTTAQDFSAGASPNERSDPTDTLIAERLQRRGFTVPLQPEVSTLRYRRRAVWLLGIYIPLLVVPWILTCILLHRPIGASDYYDQSGIHESLLTVHRRLMNALSVIFAITGLVTVPIISAILSEAAVVYTQKRREGQNVSMRQLFALADRGWSSLPILHESRPVCFDTVHSDRRADASSGFLWLAAAFLVISASVFRTPFCDDD